MKPEFRTPALREGWEEERQRRIERMTRPRVKYCPHCESEELELRFDEEEVNCDVCGAELIRIPNEEV